LTAPEVRYYVRHLAAGLRYIHSHRIIHCDLKPSNLLLNKQMELKIADFGSAIRVENKKYVSETLFILANYDSGIDKRGPPIAM